METTIRTTPFKTSTHVSRTNVYSNAKFWDDFEFNRFGIISILVVILGCLGGMAASFGAQDSVTKLSMVAFPTIITLALILAVAPMKWISYMTVLAIALDVLVFIF